MSTFFDMQAESDGARIFLKRETLLKSQVIPYFNWAHTASDLLPVVAKLARMIADEKAFLDADGLSIVIPHAEAAYLQPGFADRLGFPFLTSASCQIEVRGRVDQPDTRILQRWRDSNYSEINPKRMGTFLHYSQTDWKLSGPVYELLEAIDAFNVTVGQEPMDRISAWGPVQTTLSKVTGSEISADNYLSTLTIYQAGSFALDVSESPEGPKFIPILMSRSKRQLDVDELATPENGEMEAKSDELRDAIEDALLPPIYQNDFAKRRFEKDMSISSAYVLARNTFVVLDPSLKDALKVVQRKSRSTEAERRAFIKNPRSFLTSVLEDEAEATSLFVETKQYSDRIKGLGLWDPPALPWLARFKTAWMPEGIKITVGGQEILITEPIEILAGRIAEAKEHGESLIDINGQKIQIDELEESFTEGHAAGDAENDHNADDSGEQETTEPYDRTVLLIEENLDETSFVKGRSPRTAVIEPEIGYRKRVISKPKQHQLTGFFWLVDAWKAGWPGVLLADDMGLGKTYQTFSFLAWLQANQKKQGQGHGFTNTPILVVAPTALLRTWINESETHLAFEGLGDCVEAFGPGLRGLKRTKGPGWSPEEALDVERLRDSDWILVTYETLATYHRAFARIRYSVIVFDEMQRIKNPTTINTHSAKTLSSEFVIGLTGTPVENRLEDLWCIMDRIAPGYLGSLRTFNKKYGDASKEQLAKLKAKMDKKDKDAPAVLLRRMKEDILDGLPKKRIETYRAHMPPTQAQAYHEAVVAAKSLGATRSVMLESIHRFRGISLHPELNSEFIPENLESFQAWADRSARVKQASSILDEIYKKNEKVLIFIESKSVQRILASGLSMKYNLDIEPMIINGEVPGSKRQPMVDLFQRAREGFDAMILSPRAAGVGLTITAANHVIHLSRWWNPAVEDQCNDRIYRIGQTKPVTIHIPMAIHPNYDDISFDLKLDGLMRRKRSLSHHLLAPPENKNDVDQLFSDVVGMK